MNPKEEQTNSEAENLDNDSSKEKQINSEATNLENESSKEKQKDTNYINQNTGDDQFNKNSKNIEEEYKFGWSSYSEITNGRFAMIGFLALILVELFSQQSFLKWAGIL